MLELTPWNGAPYHKRRPDSPMRALAFGPHGEGDIATRPPPRGAAEAEWVCAAGDGPTPVWPMVR